MPTKDVSTRFRLEFEGKGAEQLQKKINTLSESLAPEKMSAGFQRMDHFMKQNMRQLSGMERHFKQLNQSLHQFGSTVDKINEMASGLSRVKNEAKGAGEEARKAGAFLQGLAQGVGVGEFIGRGPGMGRQVAGRMVGGAVRAPFAAVGGAAMSGVGGFAQGLSSIPGGGLAGGVLQAAMANVGQFRQLQRTRLGMAGFMGVSGMMATQQARARARAPIMAQPLSAFAQASDTAEAQKVVEGLSENQAPGGGLLGVQMPKRAGRAVITNRAQAEKEMAAAARRGQESRRQAAADRAAGGVRGGRTGLEGLGGLGRNLGAINLQQTTQFAAQLAAGGGGPLLGMRGAGGGGDLVSAGLAAQTMFGVGAGTTGAFGLGARRGGLGGAEGSGAEAMGRALEDAVAAGMDASEVRQFMQETAQGIQQFRSTGIPMAPETVLSIGKSFSLAGMEIGRSQSIAVGFQRRAQQVGMQGPQSAADMLLLQSVGGFQGGGLRSLEEAQERLIQFQQGDVSGGDFQDMIGRISRGSGGGVAGRFALRRALGGMGVQIGVRESRALQAQAMGEEVPEELRGVAEKVQRQLREGEKSAPAGLAGLEDQARAAVATLGKSLRGQVDIENKRLAIGAKLTTTMDNLEKSTLHAQGAVAAFGPALSDLTGHIETITKFLPGAANVAQKAISDAQNSSVDRPSDKATP